MKPSSLPLILAVCAVFPNLVEAQANLNQPTVAHGNALYSVTFDFKKGPAPEGQVHVKCSPEDKEKSCICSAPLTEFIHQYSHATYTIVPRHAFGETWGDLQGPRINGPLVSLRCMDKNGIRTPNITMVQGLMADSINLKGEHLESITQVVYKDRPLYPDEIRAQADEKKSVSGASDGGRQTVVDALQGANGSLTQAAKKLGISEKALSRKMKDYKIEATYR